ncbi:MAG: 2,3-diaminopropionate biosynthesis protein SbnB [Candidatus Binatia bacterium]
MSDGTLLMLGADEVDASLHGEEAAILDVVRRAYQAHGRGRSVVPHSTFLRFPGGHDRMIALPAYLGTPFGLAGVKWIASFPDNLAAGLARASGLVVMSCITTGRPRAVVEGSIVSAKRTAASAALAAQVLHDGTPTTVGLLGCGAINFETLRFLLHVWPGIAEVVVCDLSRARAERFAARCMANLAGRDIRIVDDWPALSSGASVVSIATTAMLPHLSALGDGTLRTVLHLSLRDLAPEVVLAADNVVDDVDHVCRADTSVHLAERVVGHRRFIRADLPALLVGTAPARASYDRPTIFSPFGLGILDIAVAELVCERAAARARGTRIPFAAARSA